MESLEEYKKERDLIVGEIGELNDEDFLKAGITMEEYNNPTAETISKLIKYAKEEYDQVCIFSE